jgi:hypothetical protein
MTMNQSARPSLYTGSVSSDNAEVFNILGVLEPTRPSARLGKRIALFMLVLLGCAGAVAAFNKIPYLRFVSAVPGSVHPAQVSAPLPATAKPPLPALAVSELPTVQASVGRIVVDEPAEKQVQAGTDIAINPNAGKPAVKHSVDVTTSQPSDVGKTAARLPAKEHIKPEKIRPKHAAHPTASLPRQAKQKDLTRKDDRDVDLIAALLTRASAANGVEKPSANIKAPKASSARGKQNTPSVTAGSEKPNRDPVVVKQPGETMGAVVRRCRSLGLIEGELCRLRVCSDKWGKDPACPSSGLPAPN